MLSAITNTQTVRTNIGADGTPINQRRAVALLRRAAGVRKPGTHWRGSCVSGPRCESAAHPCARETRAEGRYRIALREYGFPVAMRTPAGLGLSGCRARHDLPDVRDAGAARDRRQGKTLVVVESFDRARPLQRCELASPPAMSCNRVAGRDCDAPVCGGRPRFRNRDGPRPSDANDTTIQRQSPRPNSVRRVINRTRDGDDGMTSSVSSAVRSGQSPASQLSSARVSKSTNLG